MDNSNSVVILRRSPTDNGNSIVKHKISKMELDDLQVKEDEADYNLNVEWLRRY